MDDYHFTLILNKKLFNIPILFDNIVHINPAIYKSLIFQHQYQIESNIDETIFQHFINYLVNNVNPIINSNNVSDYLLLSEEFQYQPLKQLIQLFKESNKQYLDINMMKDLFNDHISIDEDQISSKLDNYLEHYGIEMLKLPIQLLFNIFTNPKRNLNNFDYLYKLIIKYYNDTNDFRIFSLLTTINISKSKGTFILNKIIECEQIINNKDFEISNLTNKIHSLEKEIRDKNEEIQLNKNTIDKLKEKSKENENKLQQIYKNIFETNEIENMNEFQCKADFLKYSCINRNVDLSFWLTRPIIKCSGSVFLIDKKTKTASFFGYSSKERRLYFPRFINYCNDKYTITHISSGFCSLGSITSIEFDPNSEIKKISSFNQCQISEIKIIPSIMEIGAFAFNECPNLKIVEIPRNSELTIIGKNAFSNTPIEKIYIPKNVKKIGNCAFMDCKNLRTVEIDQDSILETIGKLAFSESSIEKFSLPNKVKKIKTMSFYECEKLKIFEITQNSELEEIYDHAFADCAIEEIFIPINVKNIEKYTFNNCYHLKTVKFDQNSELKRIKKNAFYSCGIENISIPDHVIKIGKNAFAFNGYLKSINFGIDSELEEIDDKSFYSSGLNSFYFPSNVTRIGKESFCNSKLQIVVISENSKYISIEDEAFSNCPIMHFSIPNGIVDFQNEWCKNIYYLINFIVSPNNKNYKFLNDDFLLGKKDGKSINFDVLIFARRDIINANIPSYIKEISPYAFNNCQLLQMVNFTDDSELHTIGDYAFDDCPINSIYIPSKVQKIGDFAFSNCKINRIEFSKNSEKISIGLSAFSDAKIECFSIPSKVIDFKKGWCDGLSKLIDIKLSPNNEQYIFKDNKFLLGKKDEKSDIFDVLIFARRDIKTVSIPSYIKEISPYAFKNCSFLQIVNFDENSELHTIGDYAFSSSSIKKITIPIDLKNIGEFSFGFCQKLNCLIIPENSKLESVGKNCFYMSAIKSFDIPQKLNQISSSAFQCDFLKIVEIPENYQIDEKKVIDYFKYIRNEGIIMIPCGLLKEIKGISIYSF